MVRKLKHHEQKLLRKVDFTTYKSDSNHRAAAILRRYNISNAQDYTSYSHLVGHLRHLAHLLSRLPPTSPFRAQHTTLLLSKLYDLGLLSATNNLSLVERKLTVSAFCRRRLSVVMTRLKMAENVQAAQKLVEQGHVRVGTEVVTDGAFLVGRGTEDWVTWGEGSKIKRGIERFRGGMDDFDVL